MIDEDTCSLCIVSKKCDIKKFEYVLLLSYRTVTWSYTVAKFYVLYLHT